MLLSKMSLRKMIIWILYKRKRNAYIEKREIKNNNKTRADKHLVPFNVWQKVVLYYFENKTKKEKNKNRIIQRLSVGPFALPLWIMIRSWFVGWEFSDEKNRKQKQQQLPPS